MNQIHSLNILHVSVTHGGNFGQAVATTYSTILACMIFLQYSTITLAFVSRAKGIV